MCIFIGNIDYWNNYLKLSNVIKVSNTNDDESILIADTDNNHNKNKKVKTDYNSSFANTSSKRKLILAPNVMFIYGGDVCDRYLYSIYIHVYV